MLACADGAGSASAAHIGSDLACQTVVRAVVEFLSQGVRVAEIEEAMLHAWMAETHQTLVDEAAILLTPSRELACTLLLAIIGESASAFVQIGDGAIICRENDGYQPIFWPQSGEYINATYFLTDPQFAQHVQIAHCSKRITEVALLTDGLQMLALNYATQSVHQPFFQPLFQTLRNVPNHDELRGPLRQFLTSPRVNERTDDDKTLVLATREQSSGEAIA